ncbi:hypothetical protein S225a_20700 [Candidatus Brocadiaceae bacterium S225]|uniref:Uncharacterized protein n=1 Tax=Candidatus Scalindua brodae TaxID=237368 RepID=A0A0B0EMA8_9BACT|nr:MAG: hypothetical protein SCABRO_00030 [Candidatus Scalindua brodae]TWU31679.1 hypothetical protein S225a_20700 [Candidatus Brocadiaceae bacterium S225]
MKTVLQEILREVNVDSSLPLDQEVSFDDETVLLINLDKSCAESSID